ncbi:imm11 family protein [Flocculibacter collagenilyticus]|uniref:imm11 family protein n=1 Tax=Flocculibacter collagenilyticus TaxID=2744479 RepID=UPI001F1FA00E|nr:DUF1629 domain-containing protein [Flocculibacter collagenilyticus]
MSSYNHDYFIVLNDYHENTIYAKALKKSADRDYEFEKLTLGQDPLFFENGYKKEAIEKGINLSVTDVLMNGVFPIINTRLRDKIKHIKFKGMQLYPSVYIDDKDQWHEDYWCMNFYETVDCWDKQKSKTEKFTEEQMQNPDYLEFADIYKYVLDEKVLDGIPLKDRLIFKMDGGVDYIFIHQSIANILMEDNPTGIKLVKVSDFEEGMQF